jgi:hypothetical protein
MLKKPLSKLSYDKSNNITVCNYDNEFIDLDDIKGILKRSQSANTPDMIYISDIHQEIWFIEFKSSKKSALNHWKAKIGLRKKVFAGLFLMYEIFCEKSCDYKDYDKFYFVVYNKDKSESIEDELLDMFDELSERSIEFGLEDLKPQFVKDIFTEDCTELKKLFKKRFDIEFIKED